MNPAWATFAFTVFVWTREPTDLCSHASTFSKRGLQVCADTWRATDAVEEGRLQNSWDAQGWGGEKDAERGSWSDEEVLSKCQSIHQKIHARNGILTFW